jgi:hypothetical protein
VLVHVYERALLRDRRDSHKTFHIGTVPTTIQCESALREVVLLYDGLCYDLGYRCPPYDHLSVLAHSCSMGQDDSRFQMLQPRRLCHWIECSQHSCRRCDHCSALAVVVEPEAVHDTQAWPDRSVFGCGRVS